MNERRFTEPNLKQILWICLFSKIFELFKVFSINRKLRMTGGFDNGIFQEKKGGKNG
jgi:hypothetical protein